MLRELHIRNFALIEDVSLEFGDGLCVITGETGAGKSLLVGALQLLLGGRGGYDKIQHGADEAILSARFTPTEAAKEVLGSLGFDDDEVVLVRRLLRAGRSYFWINGVPATAETVRALGRYLVDIHGQHQHQLLLDPKTHLALLDEFAGVGELLERLGKLRERYLQSSRALEDLVSRRDEILRQRRLIQFELEELSAAGLDDPDEESKLERELARIEAAEKLIRFGEMLSDRALEGEGSIFELAQALRQQAEELPEDDSVRQVLELLDTVSAAARELQLLGAGLAKTEYDPAEAERIRQRLALLGDLQRKYRKTLRELIEYRDALARQSVECGDVDEEISRLEGEVSALRDELVAVAGELSERRREAAEALSRKIEDELAPLGLGDARFQVALSTVQDEESPFELGGKRLRLFERGFDVCEFLFSANPGVPPQPLRRIASGGELSRVALAVKVALPKAQKVGCSVFDEIDVGVGGKTALRVAERLWELARTRQVIVITHLHPIARRADWHVLVEKRKRGEKTLVSARPLAPDEREKELERMMALE